jgi:tRNA(Ile)-lysidine synthase
MRAVEDLEKRVAAALDRLAPAASGELTLAAFSGGPDSTALLLLLRDLLGERGGRLLAAHLDHGLDPGSAARAAGAAAIARRLGVPMVSERIQVGEERRAGETLEVAARRVRYAFLDRQRQHLGARWIATGHHRDDQVETVLLRLLRGTGWEGLAGIAERRGCIIRPLLGIPRSELHAWLAGRATALDDPTNHDLALPRNRLRAVLLPGLRAAEPGLDARVAAVAEAAGRARRNLRAALTERLALRADADGASLALGALRALAPPLNAAALALLHERAGTGLPPAARARRELARQLTRGRRVACDGGRGWRWAQEGGRLRLVAPPATARPFAYTFRVPGEIFLPEVTAILRLERGPAADWMFAGSPHRAGLALSLSEGDEVVVRSRQPGDRVQPLGAPGRRRLKDVLIDRRVPRFLRDRLPLLVVGGRVVWVPGVTVDESCRLDDASRAWVAELRPVAAGEESVS